jgi:hypothetical protein
MIITCAGHEPRRKTQALEGNTRVGDGTTGGKLQPLHLDHGTWLDGSQAPRLPVGDDIKTKMTCYNDLHLVPSMQLKI